MILDHAIRLQHIRANLRSEIIIQFRILDLLRRRPLFLHLKFVKLRPQHAHGSLAILVLRAFILAIRHQPRRDVRNPHRRIRSIHVLAALAAGTVSIRANVFGLDHDFNAVIDFRRDENAGKRSMPPLRLIERRNAHQPVHANFAA